MTLIRTQELRHSYQVGGGPVWALDGIDLSIEHGEFVAVMGPSGSGKSTFLNLVGCLDRPSHGQYIFEGRDISALGQQALSSIRNQKLGFVFQSFNLLPRITALENVEVPLLYSSIPAAERRCRCLSILGEVGLADRTEHTPSELSGGQQQRVAIARALVNSPMVLLADEPTGALDTKTGQEIMAIFVRLRRERGLTIVLVTHEADVAAYADRILTFRDGRVVADEIRAGSCSRRARIRE